LTTPQEREAATAAIQQNAPVGIGVVLADGPDGYPMIRELVPGSTASSSGVLQSGYQIAAVGSGNGTFTDLQGRNIGDVAPLIRGKPGSSVWLQVIPPGGTPANRLTVVVPRRQLMFKKPPGS
jgi:C-terminal processing protease CtpA/Prc